VLLSCKVRPEAKKAAGMVGQSDCATGMGEFTGEIRVFPARQGADALLVRNSHTAKTHLTARIGVPVRRVFQARSGCRPAVFCQGAHEQFPPMDHEHQGRVSEHLAVQLFRFVVSITEKHEPRSRPAPPSDQLWGSCQYMFRQYFSFHACAQPFGECLEKPCRDRLPSTQVRRLIRPALHLVQGGKGSGAVLVHEHRLFQTEGSVVSDPQVNVHEVPPG